MQNHKTPAFFLLFICSLFFTGCSSITVNINAPADGAAVGGGTFALEAEIRSSGTCMGGERCAHVDWIIELDGASICSGTGTGGGGSYSWCANSMGDYCHFTWDDIATADLGNGPHDLSIRASATCHRDETESISITVP